MTCGRLQVKMLRPEIGSLLMVMARWLYCVMCGDLYVWPPYLSTKLYNEKGLQMVAVTLLTYTKGTNSYDSVFSPNLTTKLFDFLFESLMCSTVQATAIWGINCYSKPSPKWVGDATIDTR